MQVRMGVVRDAAISVLLVLLTVVTFTAADSLDPSVCRTPTCFCANVTGHTLPDTFHVTCFVQSFSKSDRTMQKLTPDLTSLKLVCSESSTPNHLTSATFSGVPELRRLGLENCHLAAVSHDALDSLPGLQELHIQRCVFSQLPADVLSRTVKLSRLTLAHCALQDLPRLCSLQGSLELLNVSGQSLTSLDRCVEGCHSDDTEFRRLIVMDVSNNSLSRLPHAMLSKAANLRELHVQHNRISRLNFTGCTRLEILNTLGQKLEYADLTGDGCLLSFKVLQLEGNGSALFSIDDLQRMTDLTQLHLENMAVGDPIWEVLPFLRNLSHLSLPTNNLTGLNLSREVSLRHLNVSRNAVLSLESDTLAWQTRLEVLDLSWNNLTSLMSGSFVSLSSLTTLDLRHNRLRLVLQAAFRNLSGLRSLSLDANRLDTLPYFLLRETPALQELSVSGNTLTSLPSLKNAAHLVLVNARYNRISWVPALSDVPQLEYLFMRGNRLRLVRSAVFLGAPLLAILELSENNITSVDSFQHHPGLKWVQLDHNKIQDLSGVFRDLPQLGSVFADYNLLVRLTSDYFPASLHTLVVHFNQLSYVEPRMFVAMTRLRVVQLNANFNLYRLPRESVQISPHVLPKPSFFVAPNTFDCDCQMAYLKAWAMKKAAGDSNSELMADLPDFPNLHMLYCATHLTGDSYVHFDDTPLSHFVCPLTGVLCDDTCPCCQEQPLQLNPNCSCILTCPQECRCFHGGSPHFHLYTHVRCQKQNLTQVPDLIPALTTHLRLDGNRFTVLGNTTLKHITVSVLSLNLSGSRIETLEPGCFAGMDVLRVLDLSANAIGRIEDDTLGWLPALEELDLRRNGLRFVHRQAFFQLPALKTLFLSHNMLRRLDTFAAFPSTASLTLASNPWSCDCDFVAVSLKFLITRWRDVLDYGSLRCYYRDEEEEEEEEKEEEQEEKAEKKHVPLSESNNGTVVLHESVRVSTSPSDDPLYYYYYYYNNANRSSVLMSEFQFNLFCANRTSILDHTSPLPLSGHTSTVTTVVLCCLGVVVALAVATGVTCVCRRSEIQALLYAKLGVRLWDQAARLDRQATLAAHNNNALKAATEGEGTQAHQMTYDAFVSYSHQDQDFVVSTLLPHLEQQGPKQYRLCLHSRDFPVGDSIADNILDSVHSSQRVILLLSPHFARSEWCLFEFRAVHQHVLREGGHRLILVVLEDMEGTPMDPDLRMVMKTHTYLAVKDPWFWEKLYFAMPDLPCRLLDNHRHQQGPRLSLHHAAQPQDGVGVPDSPSDTRADQMLETLELTISREELSSTQSLARPQFGQDSDKEEDDDEESRQIFADYAASARTDVTEPDSHNANFDAKPEDHFTLGAVPESRTDNYSAVLNRGGMDSSPAQAASYELLNEVISDAGTATEPGAFRSTRVSASAKGEVQGQVPLDEQCAGDEQLYEVADTGTIPEALRFIQSAASVNSESKGQIPFDEQNAGDEQLREVADTGTIPEALRSIHSPYSENSEPQEQIPLEQNAGDEQVYEVRDTGTIPEALRSIDSAASVNSESKGPVPLDQQTVNVELVGDGAQVKEWSGIVGPRRDQRDASLYTTDGGRGDL